eukprot:GILJ01001795.1.p1 GENE.GILJ01001795.1~~GILJ01001795.1.p1  ORF type:complete len:213 (-),score=46.27 GILJ01001795.1:210-848(-)
MELRSPRKRAQDGAVESPAKMSRKDIPEIKTLVDLQKFVSGLQLSQAQSLLLKLAEVRSEVIADINGLRDQPGMQANYATRPRMFSEVLCVQFDRKKEALAELDKVSKTNNFSAVVGTLAKWVTSLEKYVEDGYDEEAFDDVEAITEWLVSHSELLKPEISIPMQSIAELLKKMQHPDDAKFRQDVTKWSKRLQEAGLPDAFTSVIDSQSAQ